MFNCLHCVLIELKVAIVIMRFRQTPIFFVNSFVAVPQVNMPYLIHG